MGGKSMRWADGFIAVDWGTTNRRAYRLDSSGKCVDEFEDNHGVLAVPEGGFPEAVSSILPLEMRESGSIQPTFKDSD